MNPKERNIFIIEKGNIVNIVSEKVGISIDTTSNQQVFITDNATMHRICQMMGWHYIKMLEEKESTPVK